MYWLEVPVATPCGINDDPHTLQSSPVVTPSGINDDPHTLQSSYELMNQMLSRWCSNKWKQFKDNQNLYNGDRYCLPFFTGIFNQFTI